MKNITFFSVLKNNLSCAFCKKENCPVKYMPEKKKVNLCNGYKYVTKCEKEQKKLNDKMLKRHLP